MIYMIEFSDEIYAILLHSIDSRLDLCVATCWSYFSLASVFISVRQAMAAMTRAWLLPLVAGASWAFLAPVATTRQLRGPAASHREAQGPPVSWGGSAFTALAVSATVAVLRRASDDDFKGLSYKKAFFFPGARPFWGHKAIEAKGRRAWACAKSSRRPRAGGCLRAAVVMSESFREISCRCRRLKRCGGLMLDRAIRLQLRFNTASEILGPGSRYVATLDNHDIWLAEWAC